ncbi:MAG: hypothetical protein ABIH99_04160 [Candidatus Micrarchaeota archaeon]
MEFRGIIEEARALERKKIDAVRGKIEIDYDIAKAVETSPEDLRAKSYSELLGEIRRAEKTLAALEYTKRILDNRK